LIEGKNAKNLQPLLKRKGGGGKSGGGCLPETGGRKREDPLQKGHLDAGRSKEGADSHGFQRQKFSGKGPRKNPSPRRTDYYGVKEESIPDPLGKKGDPSFD